MARFVYYIHNDDYRAIELNHQGTFDDYCKNTIIKLKEDRFLAPGDSMVFIRTFSRPTEIVMIYKD